MHCACLGAQTCLGTYVIKIYIRPKGQWEMTFSAKPTLCKECKQKCLLRSDISLSR